MAAAGSCSYCGTDVPSGHRCAICTEVIADMAERGEALQKEAVAVKAAQLRLATAEHHTTKAKHSAQLTKTRMTPIPTTSQVRAYAG